MGWVALSQLRWLDRGLPRGHLYRPQLRDALSWRLERLLWWGWRNGGLNGHEGLTWGGKGDIRLRGDTCREGRGDRQADLVF